MSSSTIEIRRITGEFPIAQLEHEGWQKASSTIVNNYWSGEPASDGRSFQSHLLWSGEALYVRFEAARTEPLTVSAKPEVTRKAIGLWERDVCELFIAPDTESRNQYFEFEVAPTGEWLDLAIDMGSGERITDWEYESGMQAAASIEEGRVLMAMKIPWKAFGQKPKAGDVWLGNIFRCVGEEPDRGFLAWSPTKTEIPNFHVPERFGRLIFVK